MTVATDELKDDFPQEVSEYESVAEKLSRKMDEHLQSATQAFSDQEFAEAFKVLDSLPDSRRTPGMRELHRKCLELQEAQKNIESAERSSANGDYAYALRTLEKIPEYARSNIISNKLDEARSLEKIGTHLDQARRYLADYEYDTTVRILENVPKEDRVEEFNALWSEATEKQSLVKNLRKEVRQNWSELKNNSVIELCTQTVLLLEQLIGVQPNDTGLKEQLNQANLLGERIQERDTIFADAQEKFDALQYEEAIELLHRIDEDLRPGKVAELESKSLECLQEIERLTGEILAALDSEEYQTVPDLLTQLDEFHLKATENVAERLSDSEYEGLLFGLARQIRDGANLVTLFDRFVDAIDFDRLCQILSKPGEAFLQECPDQQTALKSVLVRILDSLTDRPEKIRDRLKALDVAREYLGEHTDHLDKWKQLMQALDEFEQVQNRRWRWFRKILQNPQTSKLVSTGRRLAEAASDVLPNDTNRWQQLQKISGDRLNSEANLVCRVYSMINQYLKTKEWPSEPLTSISMKSVSLVASLAMAAAVVQYILSFWFLIHGPIGFAAIFFQLIAVTVFYKVSAKLM